MLLLLMPLYFLPALLVLSQGSCSKAPNYNAQQQLFFELTKHSYASMAPFFAYNEENNMVYEKIEFDPLSMRIAGVEEKQQTIDVVMRATITWKDYRLSWNSSEYGDITKIVMTRDSVWRPLVLPCKYLSLETDDNEKGLVMVNNSGYVRDIVTWSYVAPVNVSLHKFPFDEHALELCFDVQALDDMYVNLVGDPEKKSYLNETGSEWEITQNLTLKANNLTSNAPLYFTISLKRYSTFWVNLIIIPCFVLGFLIIAGLVLNSDNPTIESVVNIGLASTVSTAVVISTMTDNFPKTSQIPSLGSFVRNQIFIILAAIITLSIRRSLMTTTEILINCLEKDNGGCPKWRTLLARAIKVVKYRYFLFIVFELAHLGCFLYMMRHHFSKIVE